MHIATQCLKWRRLRIVGPLRWFSAQPVAFSQAMCPIREEKWPDCGGSRLASAKCKRKVGKSSRSCERALWVSHGFSLPALFATLSIGLMGLAQEGVQFGELTVLLEQVCSMLDDGWDKQVEKRLRTSCSRLGSELLQDLQDGERYGSGSVQEFVLEVQGFIEDYSMPRDLEKAQSFVTQERAAARQADERN
eukprot:Skav201117  [mRNA]  locus=scaffold185:422007:425146:+ [translate_table: standard]